MRLCLWCWVGLCLWLPAQAHAHTNLYIPLTLQEALPNNPDSPTFQLLKGMDRLDEPVTFTIPLDPDLESINYVLIGAKYAQITPLTAWPNGRPRWIKLHSLVDLRGGEQYQKMFFTLGEGNLTAPDMAKDSPDKITVDTGAAQFTLRKTQFNGLDQVQIGSTTFLRSAPLSGLIAEDADGKTYSAESDPNLRATIEENGPVRAILRIQGTLRNTTQESLADFTLRLAFTRARSDVRLTLTLQNASKQRIRHLRLRSLRFSLASQISAPRTTFSTHTTPFSTTLQTNDAPVTLFQGRNRLPALGLDLYPADKHPARSDGYTIQQAQQSLASGTTEQPIALFFAQLSASQPAQGVITFGTRFAAQYAPQSLEISPDGRFTLYALPPQPNHTYTLRFGSHHTTEHLLDFATKTTDASASFFRYQYPLVIRPKAPEWHNEAFSAGIDRLISFKEEESYFTARNWKVTGDPLAIQDRRPQFAPVRALRWDATAPLLHDPARIDLLNYFRQEAPHAGTYYLQAHQRLAYYADQSVFHSDDFDASDRCQQAAALCKNNLPTPDADLAGAEGLPPFQPRFPLHDRHAYSLALGYHTTGDPRLRDAFLAWGEHLLYESQQEPTETLRSYAWKLLNLTKLYVISKEARYQQAAWALLQRESLDKSAKVGESSGTDWMRGFFVPSSQAKDAQRTQNTEEIAELLLRAYASFLDDAALDETQRDKTRSLLEGLARFVSHELWRPNTQKPAASGYPKQYNLDTAPPTDPTTLPDWQDGLRAGYLGFFFTYLFSRDKRWLENAERLQEATANNQAKRADLPDHPSRQTLHHAQEATILYAAWRPLPLRVDRESDGSYILRWLAPPAVKTYQFKYAQTPIVDWLDYNPQTRTFGKDPAQHTAFFAAQDILQEPAPTERGTLQSIRLNNLPKDQPLFFAARYASTDPRDPTPLDPEADLEALQEPPSTETTADTSLDASTDASTDSAPDTTTQDPTPPNNGCHCEALSPHEGLVWLGLLGLLLAYRKRRIVPQR